jgi:hypothetical protein
MTSTITRDPREFSHYSARNAALAQANCPANTCQAYRDIFTYRRWRALGEQVAKGAHGTRLLTRIPIVRKTDTGEEEIVGSRGKTTVVFCRHHLA